MVIYPHSCFAAASAAAFYNTSRIAFKEADVYAKAYSSEFAMVIASIVNMALSCELALKSILPNETIGHNLNTLFHKLDSNTQNEITEYVCLDIDKHSSWAQKACHDRETFETLLESCSQNFTDARYIHEGKIRSTRYDLWFLSAIARSILISHGYEIDSSSDLLRKTI